MTELIALGMCILGMLGAFHFGTRKYQDGVFESSKKYDVTEGEMDIPEEPTDEEYLKAMKSRMIYAEEAESNTG